jgi:hypothetical protein
MGEKTKDSDRHGQNCPHCGSPLACVNDYIGGGSHYWMLRCDSHGLFEYGTYDWKLREVKGNS